MRIKRNAMVLLASAGLFSVGIAAQAQEFASPTMESFEIEVAPPEDVMIFPFELAIEQMPIPVMAIEGLPPPPMIAHGGPPGHRHDGDGPGKGECPMGMGGGGCPLFAGIDLTDDQYEQLYSIKRDAVSKISGKTGELAVLNMDLKDALMQANIDKSKAQAVQARINALKSDVSNIRLDERIAMLNLLTPEQRKEMRRNALKMSIPGRGGHRMFRRHMRMAP